MQAVDLERIVVFLPKTAVKKLDTQAEQEGLSRSGVIRIIVLRFLREEKE